MKMKKYWILVAMLGTCVLWTAKAWGIEQIHLRPDYAGGYFGQVDGKNFSSHPDYAGGYFGQVGGEPFYSHSDQAGGHFGQVGGYSGYTGYGGYGGGTGDKTIGGGIITTTNSKMTNDWLEFDNQLKHDSAVWQVEKRKQEIAEREMAEDLSHRQAQTRYELAEVQQSQQTTDPISIIESDIHQELKQLSDYFDSAKYDLDQQNLKPQEYLAKIDQLRQQVKEAEFTIHQKAQARIDNMGQIIQLMKEGTLSKEAGQRELWRVAGLDDETINAMLPRTKPIDAEIHAKQAQLPKPAKGMITGIIYSENSPSALLNSQIIHEGDIIQGIKVVKIRKGAVEFEKDGKKWTQGLGGTPAPYWE